MTRYVPVPVCAGHIRSRRPQSAPPAVQRTPSQSGGATRVGGAYAQSVPRGSARPVSSARPVRKPDGLQIIRQHLASRGIRNVGISHILRIDNQLVSVSFAVRDRNLIVKYWNPQSIESLPGKAAFKQKLFERYRTSWKQLAATHESYGGRIYTIEAADKEQIVAALESCDPLDTGGDAVPHASLYAKN